MTLRLDFFVIGIAKCGTTSLHSLLAEQPQLFLPSAKDYRLFDLADPSRRWDQYQQRFDIRHPAHTVGDTSVWCSDPQFETRARDHLLDAFPEIKIIMIVRDPIDRIESSFREAHHSGHKYGVRCPFDLAEALARDANLIEGSRYLDRLQNWAEVVPPERRLVLFLEDLKKNPQDTLSNVLEFLAVSDGLPNSCFAVLNSGRQKLRDTPAYRTLQEDRKVIRLQRRLPETVQDDLLLHLGLRELFPPGEPKWSQRAADRVLQELGPSTERFLHAVSREPDIWPRMASAMASGAVEPKPIGSAT